MDNHLELSQLEPLPVGGLRNLLRKFDNPESSRKFMLDGTGRIALYLYRNNTNDIEPQKGFVYFKNHKIYSITYEGFTPPIATRLLTGGFINEEIYLYLNQLDPMLVGDEAVKNNYVAPDSLDTINRQMMLSSLTYLYGWQDAFWRWEADEIFDGFQIPEISLHLILSSADERIGQWDALLRNFPQATKPDAIPCPGPEWDNREAIDPSPEMNRIAALVASGKCPIAKIAMLCGFTRFEIADKLAKATSSGVITVMYPTGNGRESILERSQLLNEYNTAKLDLELAQSNLASAEFHFKEVEMKIEASQQKN